MFRIISKGTMEKDIPSKQSATDIWKDDNESFRKWWKYYVNVPCVIGSRGRRDGDCLLRGFVFYIWSLNLYTYPTVRMLCFENFFLKLAIVECHKFDHIENNNFKHHYNFLNVYNFFRVVYRAPQWSLSRSLAIFFSRKS